MKTGIALAGGGIRGFAHIGILEVIEDMGYSFDYIGGTSIGAIIASLVATGFSSSEILAFCFDVEESLRIKKIFSQKEAVTIAKTRLWSKLDGFIDSVVVEEIINSAFSKIGAPNLKNVQIPITIPSVDIDSGRLVFFTSDASNFPRSPDVIIIDDAPLSVAVRASCSFPIIISSTSFQGMRLVDGGLRMNIPVYPVRVMGAERVLACSLENYGKEAVSTGVYSMALRSIDIMTSQLTRTMADTADAAIRIGIGDVGVFDVGKGKDCYHRGYAAATTHKDEIDKIFKE